MSTNVLVSSRFAAIASEPAMNGPNGTRQKNAARQARFSHPLRTAGLAPRDWQLLATSVKDCNGVHIAALSVPASSIVCRLPKSLSLTRRTIPTHTGRSATDFDRMHKRLTGSSQLNCSDDPRQRLSHASEKVFPQISDDEGQPRRGARSGLPCKSVDAVSASSPPGNWL
jgi:hypothetical protein